MTSADNRGRLCPDCHKTLAARAFHDISLDVCQECGGVWFDGGEMEALRSQSPAALTEIEYAVAPDPQHHPHIDTERWCPACPRPLERFSYSTDAVIEVDVCPRCSGVWVVDGQLARIQAWTQLQRLPKFMKPTRSADDMALELAQATYEHEAFMARAHALTQFLKVCVRRNYRQRW